MSNMRIYSDTAWEIASKYSNVLASETRDLAAWIDKALADEREACAVVADTYSQVAGGARTVGLNIGCMIRNRT